MYLKLCPLIFPVNVSSARSISLVVTINIHCDLLNIFGAVTLQLYPYNAWFCRPLKIVLSLCMKRKLECVIFVICINDLTNIPRLYLFIPNYSLFFDIHK